MSPRGRGTLTARDGSRIRRNRVLVLRRDRGVVRRAPDPRRPGPVREPRHTPAQPPLPTEQRDRGVASRAQCPVPSAEFRVPSAEFQIAEALGGDGGRNRSSAAAEPAAASPRGAGRRALRRASSHCGAGGEGCNREVGLLHTWPLRGEVWHLVKNAQGRRLRDAPAFIQSGRRDLNPRPSRWQRDALPLSYARGSTCQPPIGTDREVPKGPAGGRQR